MNRLLTDDLWAELGKLASRSKRKQAAVAYFTPGALVSFAKGDTLVVDGSDAAIKAGETSAEALRAAYKRGVVLYSCKGLHAKAMVFENTAFVGSANLSASSQNLREAGVLSSSPTLVSSVRAYIDRLTSRTQSTRIDQKFLTHISRLPVTRRHWNPSAPSKARRFTIPESRVWLLALCEPDDAAAHLYGKAVEHEEQDARRLLSARDNRVWSFWWRGKGRLVANSRRGDTILEVYFDHASKRILHAYEPATLLTKKRILKRTYFFCESSSKQKRVTPSTFKKWAGEAGLVRPVGFSTARQLRPAEAEILLARWEALLSPEPR